MRKVSGHYFVLLLCIVSKVVVESCQQNGELVAVPEACEEYDECMNGKLIRKQCDFGKYFNGIGCDDFWKVNCTRKACVEGMIYPRGLCSIDYDVCYDGRLSREVCPALYRFNGVSCVPMETCQDAGKCTEGDRVKIDGSSYVECTNGEFLTKYCKPGYRFQNIAKTCLPLAILSVSDQHGFCQEADRLPLPDCKMYQECVNGRYEDRTCPEDMLFDIEYKMCKFKFDATCDDGSCFTGQLTPVPNDCSSYYTCKDGVKTSNSCGLLKGYFDPVLQQCTVTKSCDRIRCKGDWTKVSDDCTNYTICRNGYQITYYCGPWQKYNKGTCSIYNKCEHSNALFVQGQLQCIDGQKKRVYGRCTEYEQCINKAWHVMKCPKGTNFQTDACEKKECPLRPVLNHCQLFMQPESDTKHECPIGYLFDVKERQCVFTASATCAEGECIDNTLTNHPTDCNKYKQCENGKWTLKSCPMMHPHFDITSKQCKLWSYECKYNKINCTEGAIKPDESDCKKYLQCTDNSWRAKGCFFFKHFDATSNSCSWFHYKCFQEPNKTNNDVDDKTLPNVAKLLQSKTNLVSQCVEGEKKLVDNTCRWYTECINGNIETKRCSPCKNFNSEEKKCDWVWKRPCKSGVTDPPYVTTSTTIEPTTTTSTAKPTIAPSKCQVENEKRAVPGNCSAYQLCQKGVWIDTKCSVWGKFDSVTNTCVYFQMWKVHCA